MLVSNQDSERMVGNGHRGRKSLNITYLLIKVCVIFLQDIKGNGRTRIIKKRKELGKGRKGIRT